MKIIMILKKRYPNQTENIVKIKCEQLNSLAWYELVERALNWLNDSVVSKGESQGLQYEVKSSFNKVSHLCQLHKSSQCISGGVE